MTNTERLQHNPELQAFCMAAALSNRGMLELMHPEEDIGKALSSYNEFKDFQKRIRERRKPFEDMLAFQEQMKSIDFSAISDAIEKKVYLIPGIEPPHWQSGRDEPTDEEPPSTEFQVTGFEPEEPK